MLIFVYISLLVTASYWVIKTLAPEMAKPPIPKDRPQISAFDYTPINEANHRIDKLEGFLAEKNKNISLLQKELMIFHAQVRSFEKVKALLEEEIQRLKEQNRIFRSELGLPSVQPKENSIT